jgi:hypothetical protein
MRVAMVMMLMYGAAAQAAINKCFRCKPGERNWGQFDLCVDN